MYFEGDPHIPLCLMVQTISGQVTDGDGMPVTDAMLEFWQADSNGTYNQTGSSEGWGGRAVDAAEGRYSLRTIMPGRTSSESSHTKVWVVARGINLGLHTRIYFADFDNEGDIVLNSIVSAARAATLVAEKTDNGYNFDIWLQGEKAAVFLNV